MTGRRGASLELDGMEMSHRQIADALDAMVFTAARGWMRTVKMDADVRDLIVTTLRLAYAGNYKGPKKMTDKLPCCHIGCDKAAEYEIYNGTPEYAHSCLEHIPDLMTERMQHTIFKLPQSDDGEELQRSKPE